MGIPQYTAESSADHTHLSAIVATGSGSDSPVAVFTSSIRITPASAELTSTHFPRGLASATRPFRGPAILAAFLSVAAFDFFFVAPRFSFAFADIQYLVTFSVMLVVALVIGQMTAGLTYQARVAQRREDRMRALYDMSRLLSAALMTEQVAEIGSRFLSAEFSAKSALLVADDNNKLQAPLITGDAPQVDVAIARWTFDKA